ncbi:DUF72 domain-containing protein [Texcoconibacillus texcoconensis]|uniref:Uncharacterized protein YecE (DUF72 family) n=1 Tax=Texcoconibacillus texcoconensis TaxID=1095777 RepID=A0A840QQC5_9BACI|nr:DUF72 domain-containing protein [Texcoconibacillus texcoconensis]MBB5173523.1 uncharacterized protein YecE (DUF72 family) [Texcoconibacillus texcoconensis]
MIRIGLTGWGDHDSLYENQGSAHKLATYGSYFPIVELDASFYANQPERNMLKWIRETPDTFQFVVKAYQGITGHDRGENSYGSKQDMFSDFRASIEPLREAGKLAMVLCQFPPWFDCRREHVDYLRYCRAQLTDIDVALEFRHYSWFSSTYKQRTLSFMEEEQWVHSICDEPQAGEGSIPMVVHPTHPQKTLFRFHGRNVSGWKKPEGADNKSWRDVRYLYDYSIRERQEFIEQIQKVAEQSQDIYIVFNNNSGGHAAQNALKLIEEMKLKYEGLAPRQLQLFD